jgi:Fic family protein
MSDRDLPADTPELTDLRRHLDALRPLDEAQIRTLWPMVENESVFYTYATNAIEGSTLSLGETAVVLNDGVTIGGKTVREHLDAINGEKAYRHMLGLAKGHAPIDEEVIKDLHAYAVGPEQTWGGLYRNDQRWISGSRYVPPAWTKVRPMMKDALAEYAEDARDRHPVVTAAKLHYNIAAIHPFPDYNGRTARLAMNLHLVRSGFPPVSIAPGDQRADYFKALEASNFDPTPYYPNRQGNPEPFIAFITELVQRELARYVTVLNDLERAE